MAQTKRQIDCECWWDQKWCGRQLMHQLSLTFDAVRISGSGIDIIGLFTFKGTIDELGKVTLVKKYLLTSA
jgi:hypothetical protein